MVHFPVPKTISARSTPVDPKGHELIFKFLFYVVLVQLFVRFKTDWTNGLFDIVPKWLGIYMMVLRLHLDFVSLLLYSRFN